METQTEDTGSSVQAESLWSAIEGAKSSETDTHLTFLQDQADPDGETSVVEELFQVLEQSVDKATPPSSALEELPLDGPPLEGRGEETGDEDDTDSSFSLPLPDDDIDEDFEPVVRKKISAAGVFADLGSEPGSRRESLSETDQVAELTEADAAAVRHFVADGDKEGENAERQKQDEPAAGRIRGSMYGAEDSSEEEEESVERWSESEIIKRLGATDRPAGKDTVDIAHSAECDLEDDDHDEDTEISELQSLNDELKAQVAQKDEAILEMEATARTLKQVIRDQMTESKKMIEAEGNRDLEEKLAECKMKEDTLKRVVKDLQSSEQSLKEQLNQFMEEKEELSLRLKFFEQKEDSLDSDSQNSLLQKCQAAEDRVKEIEKLNLDMMEKYETELAEKDERNQVLEEENQEMKDAKLRCVELEETVHQSQIELREQSGVIAALKERLAGISDEDNKVQDEKEQLLLQLQEMQNQVDAFQKDFARKNAEVIQCQAQLKLTQEDRNMEKKRSSELQNQLERLQDTCEKKSSAVTELKKQLMLLEEENEEEAAHYLEMKNQLDNVQKDFARKCSEVIQCQAQVQLMQEQREADKENSSAENDELDRVNQDLGMKCSEIAQLKEELALIQEERETESSNISEMKDQLAVAQTELARKCSEIVQLQAQVQLLVENQEVKSSEMISKEQIIRSQEMEIQNLLSEIGKKERAINDLQARLSKDEERRKAELQDKDDIINEMNEKSPGHEEGHFDEELITVQKQLNDLEDSKQRVMDSAEKMVAQKFVELVEVKAAYTLLKEKCQAKESVVHELEDKNHKLQDEIQGMKDSMRESQEEKNGSGKDVDEKEANMVASLTESLKKIQSELENAREDNQTLTEKLNELSERQQKNDQDLKGVVNEDVIVASSEATTAAMPSEMCPDTQQTGSLKEQLGDRSEEVQELENQVHSLQEEKAALETRLRGIEDLLKDSVIDNEDMLRERIVELEMVEKTLKRKVQELEAAGKDAEERAERATEEMKELEESYEERFKEMRESEQMQMDKEADLEESTSHWKREAETMKEQMENLEDLNQSLKHRLKDVETELEELQVVSKLAGDELGGTQKSIPSLMDEGLGALDTGRTDASIYEEDDYEDDDDEFALSDELPHDSTVLPDDETGKSKEELQERIEVLEKSEAELMEKVEILQESENQLAELLDSLQQNESIVREASEQLEQARQQSQELEKSLKEAQAANQDLEEQMAELEIERDELALKVEEMNLSSEIEGDNTLKNDELIQLRKDFEAATEEKMSLASKVKELEEGNQVLVTKCSDLEQSHHQTRVNLEEDLKRQRAINEELVSKLADIEAGNTNMSYSEENVIKLEEENREITRQLQEAEEERTAFRERMKSMEADINYLEELKAGGEQSIAELSFQIETLEEEVASKSKKLEQNESMIGEHQDEVRNLKKQVEEKTVTIEDLESQLHHYQEECTVKNKMFQDNVGILEKKVVELEATKQELASATATCDKLRAAVTSVESTMEEMRNGPRADGSGTYKDVAVVEEVVVAKEAAPVAMAPPLRSLDRRMDDDDDDSTENEERFETAPTIEALQLRIQHLMDNEERLREKIFELEERQGAFNDTLAAADSIMSEREKSFREDIEKLENSNDDLHQMLREAKRQGGNMKRRLSVLSTTDDEDYSIFDCIDEDEEEDYNDEEEDVVSEGEDFEKRKFSGERRRSSVAQKFTLKPKKSMPTDTLTQSQEKIADLMIKIDDLEKQNGDLLHTLKEKDEQDHNCKENELRDQLRQAQQDVEDRDGDISMLRAKVQQLKPLEEKFQQFLAEKEQDEADGQSTQGLDGTNQSASEVQTPAEREKKYEALVEELRDTKESEQTMMEISREQDEEIQRLKDEVQKLSTRIAKDKMETSVGNGFTDLQHKLSALQQENQDYVSQLHHVTEELNQGKKDRQRLEEEVVVLNAHVGELERSETKVKEDLLESEKSKTQLKKAQEQAESTVKMLEDSIEMLTAKMQESDVAQDRVKTSNKILESKFKDMLLTEANLKDRAKQAEDARAALQEQVVSLEAGDERWRREMQEMEEAILGTKRHSRKLEEEVKVLKLDNDQMKHENSLMKEKVETKRSQELQTQSRLSEMELVESNLRLQLKNVETREGKQGEKMKELENTVALLKQKSSRIGQLETSHESIKRDLQEANMKVSELQRSKINLEERLDQAQKDLKVQNKEWESPAALSERDPAGAREGTGGAAGEVWMRLDQKNKELREVQELYNQSVKECMKLKESLRNQRFGPYQSMAEGRKDVEIKSTQTGPLKFLTKSALQAKIITDGDECTLEDFLNALPNHDAAIKGHAPLIETDQHLIQMDQSAPSFLHRQPIREQPIGEEEETGHVTMVTRPVVDDNFDFDSFGLAVDEIDKLRVGSSFGSDDADFSLTDGPPPLPETARPHRRTNSTSSDVSDLAPPLPPSLPPPGRQGGGVEEEGGGLPSHQGVPSVTEEEIEPSLAPQPTHTGPPQLRQPTAPGSRGPPVAPKPGTPAWLKKMMDWQSAEKEKEQGEYGRMKEKVEQLVRTNLELEEQARQLRVEREQMRRQVQGAADARQVQQKLQGRELELEEKERQVIRLKTEVKEREVEVIRLKSQLDRTQEQLRDKERLIHSHDAVVGRLKADVMKKEAELIKRESALQLKTAELERAQTRVKLLEDRHPEDGSQTATLLAEYSSRITALTNQNETLQTRLAELEPLELRVHELQQELTRSTGSTRTTEELERKLQLAQKMLQEKTEQEMRLAEDNACLQQRVRTVHTKDAYTKSLERDHTKLEDQMAQLEHERNEAELSVAPLKAKVSYLTKKCQERDDLIRKLKHEIVRVRSDKSSELLHQIGNLSTLLPEEAYNEPLKTQQRHKDARSHGRSRRAQNGTRGADLSDLLNEDEKAFLKRESLEHEDADSDFDDGRRGGEISLEDLLRQTSGHRRDIGRHLDDINLDDLDLGDGGDEEGEGSTSDQFSVNNDIGFGRAERNKGSPVSFGFGSKSPYKQRKTTQSKMRSSVRPMPASIQTSPESIGFDLPDGLPSVPLAMHHAPPSHPYTSHTHPTYPIQPPSFPPTHPSIPPSAPMGQQLSQPYPPGPNQYPSNTPFPTLPSQGHPAGLASSSTNPYLSSLSQPLPPPVTPPVLNNSLARLGGGVLPSNQAASLSPSVASGHYGRQGVAPSGGGLQLSHQNVLHVGSGQQPVNGHHGPPSLIPDKPAMSTGSGIPDPPRSLSVSREVSRHSVLLTWSPPSMDVMSRSNGAEVVGYRIFVNGQQKQLVSSAHLTKALVDGIYLKSVHKFGICTVSASGLTSSMTEIPFNATLSMAPSTASESGRSESARDVSTDRSGEGRTDKEERLFMAIYSYHPESHSPNDNPEYELTFTEGELITVYGQKRPDGFYHGKVKGRKGLVPSNFIEELPKSDDRKRESRESMPRRSRDSLSNGKRTREKKGKSERESRRREGQTHRGSRV